MIDFAAVETDDQVQGLEFVPTPLEVPPYAMTALPHPEVPPWGAPPPMQPPQWAPPGMGIAPSDLVDVERSNLLGVSIITLLVGAGVGHHFGGAVGGIVGFLGAGAAVNTYRAVKGYTQGSPEGDAEARVAGTFAVVGAAAAGGIAYKWWPRHHSARLGVFARNESSEATGDFDESSPLAPRGTPCSTRRVGP